MEWDYKDKIVLVLDREDNQIMVIMLWTFSKLIWTKIY